MLGLKECVMMLVAFTSSVLFQLGEYIGHDLVEYGVMHVGVKCAGFVGSRVILPMLPSSSGGGTDVWDFLRLPTAESDVDTTDPASTWYGSTFRPSTTAATTTTKVAKSALVRRGARSGARIAQVLPPSAIGRDIPVSSRRTRKAASPSKTTASGADLHSGTADVDGLLNGRENTFLIHPRMDNGEPATEGGDVFAVEVYKVGVDESPEWESDGVVSWNPASAQGKAPSPSLRLDSCSRDSACNAKGLTEANFHSAGTKGPVPATEESQLGGYYTGFYEASTTGRYKTSVTQLLPGGLEAKFWGNGYMLGSPMVRRVDPQISFNWGLHAVVSFSQSSVSARWEGKLLAPLSELYTVLIRAHGGIRLFLDHRLVIDCWEDHLRATKEQQVSVDLVEGRYHDIVLEYREERGSASVQMMWSSRNTPPSVIPSRALFYVTPIAGSPFDVTVSPRGGATPRTDTLEKGLDDKLAEEKKQTDDQDSNISAVLSLGTRTPEPPAVTSDMALVVWTAPVSHGWAQNTCNMKSPDSERYRRHILATMLRARYPRGVVGAVVLPPKLEATGSPTLQEETEDSTSVVLYSEVKSSPVQDLHDSTPRSFSAVVAPTSDDGNPVQRERSKDVPGDVVDPATSWEDRVAPVGLSTAEDAHQQTPTPTHGKDWSLLKPSFATEKGDGLPSSYEDGVVSSSVTPDTDETGPASDWESRAAGQGVPAAPGSLGSEPSSVVAVAMWTLLAAATVGMACVVVAWSVVGVARGLEPEPEPPDGGEQARETIELITELGASNTKPTTELTELQKTPKVTTPSTTASEMVPHSLVPHVSKQSVESSAVKETACSENSDRPEVMMPFQLGDGEKEEASSFVPSSVAGSRVARPLRWSMEYLRDNAEGGRGRVVATGNFGKVAVTTHKTSGLKIAVKSIALHTAGSDSMHEIIETELKTLEAAAKHPNVVDFFGYIKTSVSVLIMMPMIKTDLAELMAKVGPLGGERAENFMRQVISAVEYIHDKNIMHRDLKPANLLLTEDETLQLADFGLAAIIPPGETVVFGSRCGTKAYMSPEQVASEGGLDYSLKVDTWGLGVIAYELLHDDTPFRAVFGAEGVSDKVQGKAKGSAAQVSAEVEGLELKGILSADSQERANILSGTFAFDDKLVSTEAKGLISKLLEPDVEKRLSARDAAEHPWLGGLDKALEIRTKAAHAVAARESEMSAEKARLAQGRRRGVRRRVTAPVVRTEQGKGVVSGVTGGGEEAKCQA